MHNGEKGALIKIGYFPEIIQDKKKLKFTRSINSQKLWQMYDKYVKNKPDTSITKLRQTLKKLDKRLIKLISKEELQEENDKLKEKIRAILEENDKKVESQKSKIDNLMKTHSKDMENYQLYHQKTIEELEKKHAEKLNASVSKIQEMEKKISKLKRKIPVDAKKSTAKKAKKTTVEAQQPKTKKTKKTT